MRRATIIQAARTIMATSIIGHIAIPAVAIAADEAIMPWLAIMAVATLNIAMAGRIIRNAAALMIRKQHDRQS